MAEFIKAYNERDDTIIEVSVLALSESGAKVRGSTWIFGKSPANVMGMKDVEVYELDPEGVANEYRVIMKFNSRDGVVGMIKTSSIARRVKEQI